MRFLAVAKLGEGKTTPTVAAELGLERYAKNHRCRTMAKLLMKAKDYLGNYVSRRCLERHALREKLAA